MAVKFNSPAPKLSKPSQFSLPKVPQGRPMSGGQASRSTASAYGKLSKMGSSSAGIPMQKGS